MLEVNIASQTWPGSAKAAARLLFAAYDYAQGVSRFRIGKSLKPAEPTVIRNSDRNTPPDSTPRNRASADRNSRIPSHRSSQRRVCGPGRRDEDVRCARSRKRNGRLSLLLACEIRTKEQASRDDLWLSRVCLLEHVFFGRLHASAAKHLKSLSLIDCVSVGVDRMK